MQQTQHVLKDTPIITVRVPRLFWRNVKVMAAERGISTITLLEHSFIGVSHDYEIELEEGKNEFVSDVE